MANKNYTVVRTDSMTGTRNGEYLRSVRYFENDKLTEIENGRVVKIGSLLSGEREIRKATKPDANTPITEVGLVASPEILYDERDHNLSDFINEVDGDAQRVYLFKSGNCFSATIDAFDTTPEVEDIVELQADTKFKVVKTATSGSTQIGKIIAIESESGYTFYVVEVA